MEKSDSDKGQELTSMVTDNISLGLKRQGIGQLLVLYQKTENKTTTETQKEKKWKTKLFLKRFALNTVKVSRYCKAVSPCAVEISTTKPGS